MSEKLLRCPFCGSEAERGAGGLDIHCSSQYGCDAFDCSMSITDWNHRFVKPSADFLWPVEKGSVEEAGYEFANAKTADYQFDWWKILLKCVSEIELIKEAN